jgi:hypothetical protein
MWTHAYTYANSQVPEVYKGGNFHSSLIKDLLSGLRGDGSGRSE